MLSDLLLLVPVFVVAVVLLLRRRRSTPEVAEVGPPPNAMVVDGSNVMHWGGEPSLKVLVAVLQAIERGGYAPVVIFDANVGYMLSNRFLNAKKMAGLTGLPPEHVYVVDKGVVADQVVLGFADHHGFRVVSNDQFRDWRGMFPFIGRKGRLLRGSYRNGAVSWRGTL